MKWTSVKHPICEVVLSNKIPSLIHDTHLCQKLLNLLIASTELKRYKYKTCYYANTCEYHIYVKYKETKHQKLNSYRVMNSHRANSVHTAESPDPVIQVKSIYAYIMNI